jgi:hypothetical protein
MHYEKHYTLEEAQAALGTVIPMLEEIVELKERLTEKGFDVFKHQYLGGSGPNGQKFFPTEMEHMVTLVQQIHGMTIELKDLDTGLIDFPHIRQNGEEVYLCYRLGEPAIVAWHTIEGGFGGRRELSEL